MPSTSPTLTSQELAIMKVIWSRGNGTVREVYETLRAHAPGVLELYAAAARREIDLAEDRGALAPEVAGKMRSVVDSALQARPEPVP